MLKNLASPAWAMLEYGSYPLLLFIATPWFLHQLGTGGYGHWMLLTATVGFGGVLNAGTGAATIKAISAGIGRNDRADIEHAVRVSLAIALLGGAALALLVFSVFWFAGPTLLSRMGDPALIRLTGAAAAALIWLEQVDNVFSSSIKGAEHFGQAARIEIASKSVQIVVAALALWAWPALWALYLALLLVAGLRLIAKSAIARRLLTLKNLRPTFVGASGTFLFAKWGWLQGVGGMLFGVADRMLVGSLLGSSSLTYYSIASQLAMQVHAISAAGLSVVFPKVSRKLEGSGHFSLWRVTKLTAMGNLLLSSTLALTLLLLGPMILRHWIGPDSAAATVRILPWLVVAYWVLALNVVPYYILLGMGRIRFVGLTVLSCGIIAVTTMYFAIVHEGLVGAPAGRGIYSLLSLALVFPLAGHLFHERRARRANKRGFLASDRGSIQ
jgi:O-antigen/teichoic acid export membrane protein